jgi:DNA-binding NarL/FixJ family response regulator
MDELRLVVVGPDPLARAGLATLLTEQEGFVVAGRLAPAGATPAELELFRPDAILWDLGWAPEESLSLLEEAAAELGEHGPAIVALLPDGEAARAAWAAGARALLYRDGPAERLQAAIGVVVAGLAAGEPELLSLLMAAEAAGEPPTAAELTPREREVLQLLAEGLANKAIAQRLGISEHTVKFHVNAIMGKLGAESRTAAVVRATRQGLVLL